MTRDIFFLNIRDWKKSAADPEDVDAGGGIEVPAAGCIIRTAGDDDIFVRVRIVVIHISWDKDCVEHGLCVTLQPEKTNVGLHIFFSSNLWPIHLIFRIVRKLVA